jgi:hypothetical protein
MGPGMMHGPGMWGRGSRRMCNPSFAGLAEWRIDEIERAMKLTEAQQAALKELRAVSGKAAEGLASACPAEWPRTSAERLARMEAMLQAVKTVRPACDTFTVRSTVNRRCVSMPPARDIGAGSGGAIAETCNQMGEDLHCCRQLALSVVCAGIFVVLEPPPYRKALASISFVS